MAGKLNVYNLGSNGVNVDSNPIQLEDGELTKGQNAIHDPLGSTGGLRKRAGLVKVNSVAAAGAIRGGIGVPLAVAGQAVGPGGTAPAAGRTTYVGQALASTDASTGWYSTVNSFGTATRNASPAPASPVSRAKRADIAAPAVGRWASNPPAGVQYRNRIYYAGNGYTVGTTPPEIRVWDGVTDRQLCTVPGFLNVFSAQVQTKAIMHMIVGGDGFIYLSTFGTGIATASYEGHVWQLDPESGALKMLGLKFTGTIPNALVWYLNRLWMGTYTGDNVAQVAKIYFFRPGIDTAWTLDFTTAVSNGVHNFASYQGLLYASLEGSSTGGAALVKVRSAVGVWTTSLTGSADALTTYLGAVVFKGNLYVSYCDIGVPAALIKKFDGTSWTTAKDAGAIGTIPFFFYQDNGTLYAVSPFGDTHTILTTTDGTTWTDRTANFNALDELIPIMATVQT